MVWVVEFWHKGERRAWHHVFGNRTEALERLRSLVKDYALKRVRRDPEPGEISLSRELDFYDGA